MTIAGWTLIVVGLVAYIAAFAQGPGPTMADRPLQAASYTFATLFMILGFVFVAVI